MKIRTRIFICFLVTVAAGFYYLVHWVTDDLRPHYLESMEESLVDTATILSCMFAETQPDDQLDPELFRSVLDDTKSRELPAQIYDLRKESVDLRVYITDTNGIVIFDSEGGGAEGEDYSRWNDVYLTLRGEYGVRATWEDPDDPASSILYVASPVMKDGRMMGVLTVCKPTVSSNLFIESAQRKIIIAGTLAALAVVLLGAVTTTWVTRPLQLVTAYAQDVRDGRKARLPRLGRGEIAVMAEALEQMRMSLEGKEYVEQYVTTLTHELKGPLSAIRGAAELLQEDMPDERREMFLGNILRETRRVQRLVERLLLLASLEGRASLRDEELIDLRQLVDEVADGWRPVAEARDIKLETVCTDAAAVRGERFLVRHAISNVVDNALDFSPDGSPIRIAVAPKDDKVCIAIEDAGPGIPAYARERIFDRFYSLGRPGNGRKSSGLGLTFVREVLDLHGGAVHVENRPEGGARVVLEFPA